MNAFVPSLHTDPDLGEDRLRTEWCAPRVDGLPVPVAVLVPRGADARVVAAEVRRAVADACRTLRGPGQLVKSPRGFRWEPAAIAG